MDPGFRKTIARSLDNRNSPVFKRGSFAVRSISALPVTIMVSVFSSMEVSRPANVTRSPGWKMASVPRCGNETVVAVGAKVGGSGMLAPTTIGVSLDATFG